jgi:hypothetical protein
VLPWGVQTGASVIGGASRGELVPHRGMVRSQVLSLPVTCTGLFSFSNLTLRKLSGHLLELSFCISREGSLSIVFIQSSEFLSLVQCGHLVIQPETIVRILPTNTAVKPVSMPSKEYLVVVTNIPPIVSEEMAEDFGGKVAFEDFTKVRNASF